MSPFDVPDLRFLIARLHQQELMVCMSECRSRRRWLRAGGLRPRVGACLTALGRVVIRLGERLADVRAAAGQG